MINIPDDIFEKDVDGGVLCPKCARAWKQCVCPSPEMPAKKGNPSRPRLRLERSGRKGKTVTLIESLPGDMAFLEDMARTLKARTGSGGTFYLQGQSGTIEVQGDHLKAIMAFFRTNKK